jgi:hypothetical protein
MSLGMLLFIKISIWRDERDALRQIRQAGKVKDFIPRG